MSETRPEAGAGDRGEEGSQGEESLIGMGQAQAVAEGTSGGDKVEKESARIEAEGAHEGPKPRDPAGARDLTPAAARLVSDLQTRDLNILKVLAVSKIPCPVCVDLEIGMFGRLYAGYSQALQHACDYKYNRSKGVREHSDLVAAAEEALHSRRLRITHHGILPLYDLSRRSIPFPGDASGSAAGAEAHTHAAVRNTGAAASAAASNGGAATTAAASNSHTAPSSAMAHTTNPGMGSIEDATSSTPTPSSVPGSPGGSTPSSAPQVQSSAQGSVAVPATTPGSMATGDTVACTTAGPADADITAGIPACHIPLAVSMQTQAEEKPVQETAQKEDPLIKRTSQEEDPQIEGTSRDMDLQSERRAHVVEAHESLKESQGQAEGSVPVEAKLAGGHTAEEPSTSNIIGSTNSNSTASNTSSNNTTSHHATGSSSSTPQRHPAVPGRPPPPPRIKDPTGARDLTPLAARMVAKLRALDLNTLKAMALPTYQCPVCVDLQIVDWDGRTYTGWARVLQHACTYKHHRLKGVQEHSDFVAAAEEALHARRLRISHQGIFLLYDLSRRSIPFLGDASGPGTGNVTATAAPAAAAAAASNTGSATSAAVTTTGTNQATKDAIRTPLSSAPSTAGSSTPSSVPQPPSTATRYVPPPLSKGNVHAAQGSVAATAPSAGGSASATSATGAGTAAGSKGASVAAGTAAKNAGDNAASITGAGASTAGDAASIAGAGNAAPTAKSTAPPYKMTPDVTSAKRFLEGMRRHSTEGLLYVATRKSCFCPLCYHHGKLAPVAYLPQPQSQPQPGSAAQAQAVSATGTPGEGPQSTTSPPSANGHSAPAAPAALAGTATAGTVTGGNAAGATVDRLGGAPGSGEGATAFLSVAGGATVKMYPRLPALLHHCFHQPPGAWRQAEHLWLAGEIDGVLAERGLRADQVGVYRGAAWGTGHRKGFPLPSELKGTPYDVGLPGLPRQQQRAEPGAHAGAGVPGSRVDGGSESSGAPSGGAPGPKPAANAVAGTGPAVTPGAPPQGPAANSPGKGLWVPKGGGPVRKLPQAGGAPASAPNAHPASAAQPQVPHSGPVSAPNGHVRSAPSAQLQPWQAVVVRPQVAHAPAAKGPQPQPPSAQPSASATHHRPAPDVPALGSVRSQQSPQTKAQQQPQTKEQAQVETEGQAQEKGQTKEQERGQAQENGQEKGQAQEEGPLETDWPLPGASAPSVLSVLKALPEDMQEGVFGLVAFVEENERARKARRKKMTTLQYWHLNGTRNREAELREDEAEVVQMVVARAQSCEDKQQRHALLGQLRQFLGSKYAALRAHDAEALAMVKRHIDEEHALELATREKLEGLMEMHCATSG